MFIIKAGIHDYFFINVLLHFALKAKNNCHQIDQISSTKKKKNFLKEKTRFFQQKTIKDDVT